ncbi:hypothetical protein NYZ60_19105 [Acinetobacter baumannii]|nr:hypothetical protein [Acinetobacter baumannii]
MRSRQCQRPGNRTGKAGARRLAIMVAAGAARDRGSRRRLVRTNACK